MRKISSYHRFLEWLLEQILKDPRKIRATHHVKIWWDEILINVYRRTSFEVDVMSWAYLFEEIQSPNPTVVKVSNNQAFFVNLVLAQAAGGWTLDEAKLCGFALQALNFEKKFKLEKNGNQIIFRSKEKASRKWGIEIEVDYVDSLRAPTIF